MPRESFPELLVELDTLSTNLKGRLGDTPHLAIMQADLEAWVAEARGLESQQEVFEARLRETNEKRRKTEQRGVDLRGQLNAALRGHFGPKSQTLREFGFLPRGRKLAAPKPDEPPPQPAPAPTPHPRGGGGGGAPPPRPCPCSTALRGDATMRTKRLQPGQTVFVPDFLDRLQQTDDPASAHEAQWSGDWKVVSLADDQHLVLRRWEEAGTARPAAIFRERQVALLCAAVLPVDARPTLFLVRPVSAEAGYAVLVRDTYGAEASESDPVGEVFDLGDNQALALHLAGSFARSPHALALVLEAAGPTAIRLVGELLHRRMRDAP